MNCFIDKNRDCKISCMAYCEPPQVSGGKPKCFLIEAAAMMGAVSAHALGEALKSKTQHPKSAPPPQVKL